MSFNASEPNGLVTQMVVTNLPEVVKSGICVEAMSKRTHRTTRGDAGLRIRKERLRNLGDPPGWSKHE